MNAVREWTAAICMAALAAAILQGISPEGAMAGMMRLVTGAVVVCVMIVPLGGLLPDMMLALRAAPQLEEKTGIETTVQSQMEDAAQQSIRNLVTAELGRLGIKCEKVSTFMDTNADNSIGINRIEVVLAPGYASECERAAAHLEETLGLKTEVTANGGG